MEMLFDTGAEECLFGPSQILKARIENSPRSELTTLHSVSGPITVYFTPCEIRLGTLVKKIKICVQNHNMEMPILGAPFFQDYSCAVDNQAGFIRFSRASKTNFSPLDSYAVPYEEEGNKILVRAQVNGRWTSMCFDTGAFGVCMSKNQATYLGIQIPDHSSTFTKGPDGNEVQSWDVFADVSLGSINKRNCPVRILDSKISYPLLGQNFFKDRMYTIDRARKEIKFPR